MAYRKTWLHDYQKKIGGQLRRPDLGVPKPPKERDEQITLAAYLDRIGVLWCHVPNGGTRDVREAQMLRAGGVKKGVPDILIFARPIHVPFLATPRHPQQSMLAAFFPRGLTDGDSDTMRGVGVAIELKRRGATLSDIAPEQMEWGQQLALRGWYWFVARGAGEAIDELKRLGYSKF